MDMYESIAEVMKKYMKEHPDIYVNPHFLSDVRNLIQDYRNDFEDEELNEMIDDMYSH